MRPVRSLAFLSVVIAGAIFLAGNAAGARRSHQAGYVPPQYFRIHVTGLEVLSFNAPGGWGANHCYQATSGTETIDFRLGDVLAEHKPHKRTLSGLTLLHNLGMPSPVQGSVHETATMAPPAAGCDPAPACDVTSPLETKRNFGVSFAAARLGIAFYPYPYSGVGGLVPKGYFFHCLGVGRWLWKVKVPFSIAQLSKVRLKRFSVTAHTSAALTGTERNPVPPGSTGTLSIKASYQRISQLQYLQLNR